MSTVRSGANTNSHSSHHNGIQIGKAQADVAFPQLPHRIPRRDIDILNDDIAFTVTLVGKELEAGHAVLATSGVDCDSTDQGPFSINYERQSIAARLDPSLVRYLAQPLVPVSPVDADTTHHECLVVGRLVAFAPVHEIDIPSAGVGCGDRRIECPQW